MTIRYADVQAILEAAVGPANPNHFGTGRFWLKPLAEFKELSLGTDPRVKVVTPGDPATSGLIKALRGLFPFDGDKYQQMPQFRDPVSEPNIVQIEEWIRAGCP